MTNNNSKDYEEDVQAPYEYFEEIQLERAIAVAGDSIYEKDNESNKNYKIKKGRLSSSKYNSNDKRNNR